MPTESGAWHLSRFARRSLSDGSVTPAVGQSVHGAEWRTRFSQGASMRTARRGLIQMAAVAVALTASVAALASVVDGVCQSVCPGDELRRLGRELRADAALDAELR